MRRKAVCRARLLPASQKAGRVEWRRYPVGRDTSERSRLKAAARRSAGRRNAGQVVGGKQGAQMAGLFAKGALGYTKRSEQPDLVSEDTPGLGSTCEQLHGRRERTCRQDPGQHRPPTRQADPGRESAKTKTSFAAARIRRVPREAAEK